MFFELIGLSAFFVLEAFAYSSFFKDNLLGDLDTSTENLQTCLCVPYWQCKEDFSGLVEDAIDLIDVRLLSNNAQTEDPLSCSGDFDVCCKIECGRRNQDLQARSLKGVKAPPPNYRILDQNDNQADFGEFPWMLGILDERVYRCGASLIHPQVALTAAHCLSPYKKYKVRAGEWNWESQNEPLPHQDRWSKKVIIHPEYQPRSLKNDVALIILEKPFKIGDNVGIICLARPSSDSYRTDECIATGWGKNSLLRGTYQPTLKKVQLPIVGRSQCTRMLRNARLGPYFTLHRSFVCAGGNANKDTCKGDGGGPLVCPTKGSRDRYQQVGIVSWGLTCGVQSTPGVYANVPMFVDWIDKQMASNNLDTTVYRM